jgi:uncharacterized membrane protein YdbT with pleckstrin-like domain
MPDAPQPSSERPAETSLWTGTSSQWVHFWTYALCAVLALAALGGIPFTAGLSAIGLILPIGWCVGRWWLTRTTVYELTSQRLKIRSGVLNRRLDEIELYRVKDYVLEQPLLQRMLGLGNLTLVSSDATTPKVLIPAINNAEHVRELLRDAVQRERERKRVREMDVGSMDDTPGH